MIEGILLGLFWKKVQIAFLASMIVISSILSVYMMVRMDEDLIFEFGISKIYKTVKIGINDVLQRIASVVLGSDKISVNN
jgi:hypothetical protein